MISFIPALSPGVVVTLLAGFYPASRFIRLQARNDIPEQKQSKVIGYYNADGDW